MPSTTRIVLAARPSGPPQQSDFRTESAPLPTPRPGEALLETLYLSLDPYMRGRMSDAPSYSPPVRVGDPMVGGTVSRVLNAPGGELSTGDVVLGYGGWQTHSVEKVSHLRRLDPDDAPLTTALGVLGMPGFTAYAGLLEIGDPKPGETVVVAAATGPVGSAVGQIARAKGARAVGIAGGPQKVEFLRDLGFEAAIDHRGKDFANQLAAATPDGIDVYFENVGGAVWNAVLPRLNEFARVPVCGLVAGYNAVSLPDGPDRVPALMGDVLRKRLTLRGFLQFDFPEALQERFRRDMSAWIADGTVRYKEDIVDGLDHAVEAFQGMLQGHNFGKLIVKVAA